MRQRVVFLVCTTRAGVVVTDLGLVSLAVAFRAAHRWQALVLREQALAGVVDLTAWVEVFGEDPRLRPGVVPLAGWPAH